MIARPSHDGSWTNCHLTRSRDACLPKPSSPLELLVHHQVHPPHVMRPALKRTFFSQRAPAPPACCVLGRPSPRPHRLSRPTSSARETLFGSLNSAGRAVSDKEADGRLPGQVRDTCVSRVWRLDVYTCSAMGRTFAIILTAPRP